MNPRFTANQRTHVTALRVNDVLLGLDLHAIQCLLDSHDALVAALRAIVKITDGSQPKDYPGALMVAQSALKGIDHGL